MKSTERTSIIHLRPAVGVGVFAGNVAIIGQTGSGKSTYLDHLLKYHVYRKVEDLNFIETNHDNRDTVYDSRIKTIIMNGGNNPGKDDVRKVVSVLMRIKDIVDAGGDGKPHVIVIDEFSPAVNYRFSGEIPGVSIESKYPLKEFIDALVERGSERMGISFITTSFQLVDDHSLETTASTSVIRLDRRGNGIFAGNVVIGHGTGSGYTTYIESLSKYCLFGKTEEVLFLTTGPDEGQESRLDSRIKFAIAEEGEDNTEAGELLKHVFATLDDNKCRVLFVDGIDTANKVFAGTDILPYNVDKESTTPMDDLIDFLSANDSEARGLSVIAVGHEGSPYPKIEADKFDKSKILLGFDELFTRLGLMRTHIENVRKSEHFPVLAATVWAMFRYYRLGLMNNTKLDVLVIPEQGAFGKSKEADMDRIVYSSIERLTEPEYRFILDAINERLVGILANSSGDDADDYRHFQTALAGIMEEAYTKLVA